MLKLLLSVTFGALLSLPVADAVALGFGRVASATVLGQPLNVVVGVSLDADDNLSAACVSVEVHSGESRLPTSTVRVEVEAGNDRLQRSLRISSSEVIDEPVVSIDLQIACPGRLARRFVLFADPPGHGLAQRPALAVEAVASSPATRLEPGAALAEAGPDTSDSPASRSRRAASAAAPSVANRGVAALPPAGAAAPRVKRLRTAAVRPARGPLAAPTRARLQLVPEDEPATRERLNLQLTSALAPVAAAAASGATPPMDGEAAQRVRERERMLAAEASLVKLRAESQATQKALAELQLRLREAEAQQHGSTLVLALVALAAASAAGLGVLLWKRGADSQPLPTLRGRPEDWLAAAEIDAKLPAAGMGAAAQPDRRALAAEEVAAAETTASPMMLAQVQTLPEASSDVPLHAAEPEREMSVEELIDLEQQAEFFVVLGQDEAAIDLLMGHLRSSGGASPLPYLKLLEIYRRREQRDAFERIRERFNRRFNAYAPDWQSDPRQGRTLLDYPKVIGQVELLWARPAQAMKALEASLFRRDADSSPFDLPAYRELLFLYAVARDLSERESALPGVDLLLPIGGEAPDAQPMAPLHHARRTPVSLEQPLVVDVDITRLDAGLAASDERPSRFHTDFGPTSGPAGLPAEQAATLRA